MAESQGMNNHEEKECDNELPTCLDSAASNPQQRTRSFADSNNHENEKGWELGKSKHVSGIRAKKSASVLDQVQKKQSQSSWRPGIKQRCRSLRSPRSISVKRPEYECGPYRSS